ncbi:hypothetical protein CQW23_27890 [Capsicum baccatum]|uniref:Uncharacterized protein n=1 Tax=Capsicum baccatum TaxID=33114 RepID=A0A2G2VF06_CAPBA|nr:hypothetical protein CQW23_27890 [Capsicum baccatum]
MARLDDSIRLDVRLLKPPDLSTTISVSSSLEQKHQLQKLSNFGKGTWQQSRTSFDSTTNSTKSGTSLVTSFTSANIQTSNQTPIVKRLIHAEMGEKRAKGLCYNCDELYSATHQCKRLFWMELDNSVDTVSEVLDDGTEIRA